jgi:hypothetical protein
VVFFVVVMVCVIVVFSSGMKGMMLVVFMWGCVL